MKRLLFGLCLMLSLSLLAFSTVRAAEPTVVSSTPNTAALIISEVYPNGKNGNPNNPSDESGSEFIEIYNRSTQTAQLDEYELTRSGSATVFTLAGTLAPDSYVAIYPSFSLVNSGGTVSLVHKPTGTVTAITYAATVGADDSFAYHLIDMANDSWNKLSPTPNQAPPAVPPEPPEEPPIEEPPINEPPKPCSIANVHLSEIVANPSGSDALGGEFVEFFNNNDTSVSLAGCILLSDKMSDYSFAATNIIPPKSYLAVNLTDKLLNSGGTVTFQTATYEEVVQYNALGDDESWAFINNTWQLTTLATPHAINQPSPGKGEGDIEIKEEPEPCPAGKYRNPETGRCKNIDVIVATTAPCGPGKERNPETNRCRNIIAAAASLTPCDPGQERNPETNRCRKIVTASSNELAPCKEGYERNAETNRCRKTTTPSNVARIDDEGSKQNPTHDILVLGAAGAAIGGFLLYEYRGSIATQFRKLRFSKQKP